jgi:phosphatidylglycerol---prolipoprotein diacylglyceryl transferase
MLAILGVFLGGRIGYVLLYMLPKEGLSVIAQDPLSIIRVWDGGMASHGGVAGVAIFTFFYAKKKNLSWTAIGDGISVVAPIGLMFGRIANFINGELYGRVAHGVAWAVKFPQAIAEETFTTRDEILSACHEISPALADQALSSEGLTTAIRNSDEVKKIAEQFLTPRHPSQLYEAILEGAVLFLILWFIRLYYKNIPNGFLTGIFFIFYAIFRIIVEQYREPDSELIGVLTKGQFFSLFMILSGVAFLIFSLKKKHLN